MTAYRGYLITKLLTGGYAISKDGHHICYAGDLPTAERVIRDLTHV